MYGTQTVRIPAAVLAAFENDVKMYGTQTETCRPQSQTWFENDVKMYGTQTRRCAASLNRGLRMM